MKKQISFLLVFLMLLTTPSTALANDFGNFAISNEENQVSDTIIDNEIIPMILLETFERYDQSSYFINWEYRETGVARLDNRAGVNPAKLEYRQTTSGSTTASFSGAASGSAEVQNAIVAKLNATVGFTVGLSRTWSSSTTVASEMLVPAGKVGYIYAYVPGASSSGTAVYKVYNTHDSSFFYTYRAAGGLTPSTTRWNHKHVVADS